MVPDPNNPVEFLVFFILLWCSVSYGLAFIGGWHALGQHYKLDGDFNGERWYMRSGSLRLVNYGSCLTFGSGSDGLYLAVLLPFRIGHPPLLVPWRDMSAEPSKWLFFSTVRLSFKKEPSITLRISQRLGKKIAEHSSGGFTL